MLGSLQAFGRDLSAPFYQRWLPGVMVVIGCLRTLKTSETTGGDIAETQFKVHSTCHSPVAKSVEEISLCSR